MAQKLERFWGYVKEHERATGRPSFQNMRLSMFVGDVRAPRTEFPRLKGRAAEVRACLPGLLAAWERVASPGNEFHQLVKVGLRASIGMDQVLEDNPTCWRLTGAAAAAFRKCTWRFLAVFSALARLANERGQRLFNVTMKAHYLAHLCLTCDTWNPRAHWTFQSEDWMHVQRTLAQACVRGTPIHMLASKMLSKYRLALHLRLAAPGRWWRPS